VTPFFPLVLPKGEEAIDAPAGCEMYRISSLTPDAVLSVERQVETNKNLKRAVNEIVWKVEG
jgi:hypothetical protein